MISYAVIADVLNDNFFIFLCIFVVREINEQKINNSKESEIEIRKPGGIKRIQHARKRHTRTCKKSTIPRILSF
jgi:hypothetical protein